MISVLELSGEEIFDLYCTEMGKPRSQTKWYQNEDLVDIAVLNWVQDIQGIPLPREFETIPELREQDETQPAS